MGGDDASTDNLTIFSLTDSLGFANLLYIVKEGNMYVCGAYAVEDGDMKTKCIIISCKFSGRQVEIIHMAIYVRVLVL